jgi:dephospho-CoA kinase
MAGIGRLPYRLGLPSPLRGLRFCPGPILGLSTDKPPIRDTTGDRPPVVVLTGGMGAGKSTAGQAFAALGVQVIDADALAHAVTGPQGEALAALADAFGSDLVDLRTGLNRQAMRAHAFENPSARERLEAIVHPLVAKHAARQLAMASGPYAVYMVPLWVERQGLDRAAWPDWVWRLLVIDLPEREQWQRVMHRSPMPPETLAAMLARQATRAQRLAVADFCVDNSQGTEALHAAIRQLHARLCRESAQGHRTNQT